MRNIFADPESSLPDIASKACFTGFIAFNHLAYILATDERYDDSLFYHWEEYRRVNTAITETEPPELSDYASRITIWLILLGHWTGANEPEYQLLRIYSLNSDTGEYMPSRRTSPGWIKLSELKELFISHLKISLPALLFPSDDNVTEERISIEQQERPPENAFIRRKDFWEISFHGETLQPIQHMDGITYIAHLITKGTIHISDLYETAHPKSSKTNDMSDGEIKQALVKGEMSVSNMTLDKLDDKAKDDLKQYIREQQAIIDEPESLESERRKARETIASTLTTLRREYGKGPLSRKETVKRNEIVKGDADKVRLAIQRAIERIHSDSESLADYIKHNIISGTEYKFTGNPGDWTIIF